MNDLNTEGRYHYMVAGEHPVCGRTIRVIATYRGSVPVDQDIPYPHPFCPSCGDKLGEWDLHEEAEIERVAPTE